MIPWRALGVYPVPGPSRKSDPFARTPQFHSQHHNRAQPLTRLQDPAGVAVAQADAASRTMTRARGKRSFPQNEAALLRSLVSGAAKAGGELRIAAGEERLAEARNGVEAGAVWN